MEPKIIDLTVEKLADLLDIVAPSKQDMVMHKLIGEHNFYKERVGLYKCTVCGGELDFHRTKDFLRLEPNTVFVPDSSIDLKSLHNLSDKYTGEYNENINYLYVTRNGYSKMDEAISGYKIPGATQTFGYTIMKISLTTDNETRVIMVE